MLTRTVDQKIADMIELITELQDDSTVPRNVKDKLVLCLDCLQEGCEMSLRIDKVRGVLEEVSEDANLQSYTRTQIWNITSMLERL